MFVQNLAVWMCNFQRPLGADKIQMRLPLINSVGFVVWLWLLFSNITNNWGKKALLLRSLKELLFYMKGNYGVKKAAEDMETSCLA